MIWNEGYKRRIRELRDTIETLSDILRDLERRSGHTWDRETFASYQAGLDIAEEELRDRRGA